MICNPNWRENTKSKWMTDKGFIIGLKANFYNTQQAWKEPSVGNLIPDPYIDGHDEIGNQFRTRKIVKEISYKPDTTKQLFITATTPNYLDKKASLVHSSSHRTVDA